MQHWYQHQKGNIKIIYLGSRFYLLTKCHVWQWKYLACLDSAAALLLSTREGCVLCSVHFCCSHCHTHSSYVLFISPFSCCLSASIRIVLSCVSELNQFSKKYINCQKGRNRVARKGKGGEKWPKHKQYSYLDIFWLTYMFGFPGSFKKLSWEN